MSSIYAPLSHYGKGDRSVLMLQRSPHPSRSIFSGLSLPNLPFGLTWSAMAFALRTTMASLTALYIAFLGNMDDPKWAAMTVWIVAQSSRGMSLSKSRYRVIGTLIGAAAGVGLVAGFAQAAGAFILLLALWLAACTYLATNLRNFRSYGAVLAGYTAIIVALDSVSAPQSVFDIAAARVTYICLGIIVEAVFSAVFSREDAVRGVQASLAAYLKKAAETSARALRLQVNRQVFPKLLADALALDAATEYAAAASAEVRRRLGFIRATSGSVMAQLATAQGLREHMEARLEATHPLVEHVARVFDDAGKGVPPAAATVEDLKAQLRVAIGQEGFSDGVSPTLVTLVRLDALLEAFENAVEYAGALALPMARAPDARFSFHVDHRHALQNAIRSLAAVVIGAAFWILTAWPSGPAFLIILAVICALFATRPNPVAGGTSFLKGSVAAALAAMVCNFAIMPVVTSFLPMAIIFGLVLFTAGLAMKMPRYAAPAAVFAFLFLDMATPPDIAGRVPAPDFFNGALALLTGVTLGTVIFALIFPADPRAVRRRIVSATLRDLRRISRHPQRWTMEAWLSLGADRLGRLAAIDRTVSAEEAERDLRGLLSSLAIGRALIFLAQSARRHPFIERRAAVVCGRFVQQDLAGAALAAFRASNSFSVRAHTSEGNQRQVFMKCAVLMAEIAEAAEGHGAFLGLAARRSLGHMGRRAVGNEKRVSLVF